MTYAPPGSGLGGAHTKRAELSEQRKEPLSRSADAKDKAIIALRQQHKETQAKLKAEYEASRPKPGPRHG